MPISVNLGDYECSTNDLKNILIRYIPNPSFREYAAQIRNSRHQKWSYPKNSGSVLAYF